MPFYVKENNEIYKFYKKINWKRLIISVLPETEDVRVKWLSIQFPNRPSVIPDILNKVRNQLSTLGLISQELFYVKDEPWSL